MDLTPNDFADPVGRDYPIFNRSRAHWSRLNALRCGDANMVRTIEEIMCQRGWLLPLSPDADVVASGRGQLAE